jgi:hypothetical protein
VPQGSSGENPPTCAEKYRRFSNAFFQAGLGAFIL